LDIPSYNSQALNRYKLLLICFLRQLVLQNQNTVYLSNLFLWVFTGMHMKWETVLSSLFREMNITVMMSKCYRSIEV